MKTSSDMKTKYFLTIILPVLCLQLVVKAQDSDDIFTIYLVRHAEKEIYSTINVNPPLTQCGQLRAQSMASLLKDVDLDAIYSTDYTRTIKTAQPTAEMQGLEIQMYDPRKLKKLAKLLTNSKENALVVGHSNTTGVLAGLLTGEEIGPFDEKIYNRIYQVVIHKNTGRLHILHTSFSCNSDIMKQTDHPMKVAMVGIPVEDPVKAFKYYTETLGFEEVMYSPEAYIAIVKSTLTDEGPMLLLEPTEPGGLEIVKKYKKELYELGIPVMSFSSDDIHKTAEELKKKGVKFKKDPVKTEYGYEAVFDDDNGNYIQLLQLK